MMARLGERLASAILSQFVAYFLVLFLTHRFFFLRDFKIWCFLFSALLINPGITLYIRAWNLELGDWRFLSFRFFLFSYKIRS